MLDFCKNIGETPDANLIQSLINLKKKDLERLSQNIEKKH
jgi:hypothetical protein